MPSRPKRGASSRTRLSGAVPIAAALLALAAPAAAACARPDSPAASGHAGAGTAASIPDDAYAAAWQEWEDSGDSEAWAGTVADGLG